MSFCERRRDCALFAGGVDVPEGTLDALRDRYCFGAPEECARLAVARHLGPAAVPPDMLPDQTGRARQMLH